jgi:hypothetical protein
MTLIAASGINSYDPRKLQYARRTTRDETMPSRPAMEKTCDFWNLFFAFFFFSIFYLP